MSERPPVANPLNLEPIVPDVVSEMQAPSHNIAMPWYSAGFSVVPIQANGTKAPTRDWTTLQTTPMAKHEVEWAWRDGQLCGVAVICGKVSGNLEMTELEGRATDGGTLALITAECKLRAIDDVWDELLHRGYVEWTPSGGIHLLYRISDHDVPGNTKLASRPATDFELDANEKAIRASTPERVFWRVLAETRGEGGYVIVAPTSGACHPSGQSWTTIAGQQGVVPTITWAQRQAIHAAITAALDESPPPAPPAPRREIVIRPNGDLRPGDDYELKTSWEDILLPEGWSISHRVGHETFWTRPGKDPRDGHSASTGYKGDADRLYVWSSSTSLPTEKPVNKFYVYAHYKFNDDMQAAARHLRAQGFGSERPLPVPRLQSFEVDLPGQSQVVVEPPPHGGPDLSNTGYGQRMYEDWHKEYRFSPVEKTWYRYLNGAWQVDNMLWVHYAAQQTATRIRQEVWDRYLLAEAAGLEAQAKALMKDYQKAGRALDDAPLQAAVRRFSTQPGIAMDPSLFDADTTILNLPNGILDLETQTLLDHDSGYMASKMFGAAYDPDATCPNWERFMQDVVPDADIRRYLQRALGYSMTGRPVERAMFLLHGPSGTGKSVLTSVMTHVFGEYGGTAPSSTFRIKKGETNYDLHQLRGKRFIATSEMPQGAALDDELIKRITGGDVVTSRGLYQGFQDWRPKCVVWIATNFLPKVNSDDDAMWRRAKTIPFTTVFAGSPSGRTEILGLTDLLVREANGILNWLLDGLRDYQHQGLAEPEAITSDVAAYRRESDSVDSFIFDAITDGVLSPVASATVRSADMIHLYEAYCQEQRVEPLGGRRFANRLKALGYEPVKLGGKQYWRGLAMTPAASHASF